MEVVPLLPRIVSPCLRVKSSGVKNQGSLGKRDVVSFVLESCIAVVMGPDRGLCHVQASDGAVGDWYHCRVSRSCWFPSRRSYWREKYRTGARWFLFRRVVMFVGRPVGGFSCVCPRSRSFCMDFWMKSSAPSSYYRQVLGGLGVIPQ